MTRPISDFRVSPNPEGVTATPSPDISLGGLRVARAVSSLSIAQACRDLDDSKPNPKIQIKIPGTKRHPHLDLLNQMDRKKLRREPFIPASEIMDILLSSVVSLSVERPATVAKVTSARSREGTGFVNLRLAPADFSACCRERDEVLRVAHREVEKRAGHTIHWGWGPMTPLNIAYVPRELGDDVLEKTAEFARYLLPDEIVLEAVRPPTSEKSVAEPCQ